MFKSGLFLILLYISGCGLKLSPHSDIEDFRPVIPFHPEEATETPDGKANAHEEKADKPRPGN